MGNTFCIDSSTSFALLFLTRIDYRAVGMWATGRSSTYPQHGPVDPVGNSVRRMGQAAQDAVNEGNRIARDRCASYLSASYGAFFKWAMACALKWLNRRSWRRSYTWAQFQRVLACVSIAVPRITEPRGLRAFA
jgi:hypothetical protein